MKIYEVMRRLDPDFFVHSGDMIYADGPLQARVELPGGAGVWRNVVTPAKAKVAETLDEFRGNYRYNLLDEHVRRFNAEVVQSRGGHPPPGRAGAGGVSGNGDSRAVRARAVHYPACCED